MYEDQRNLSPLVWFDEVESGHGLVRARLKRAANRITLDGHPGECERCRHVARQREVDPAQGDGFHSVRIVEFQHCLGAWRSRGTARYRTAGGNRWRKPQYCSGRKRMAVWYKTSGSSALTNHDQGDANPGPAVDVFG